MEIVRIGVKVERFPKLGDAFRIAAGKIISDAKIAIDRNGKGIQFERAFHFRNGTIKISDGLKQTVTEPVMRGGVVWVEGNRFFEFPH